MIGRTNVEPPPCSVTSVRGWAATESRPGTGRAGGSRLSRQAGKRVRTTRADGVRRGATWPRSLPDQRRAAIRSARPTAVASSAARRRTPGRGAAAGWALELIGAGSAALGASIVAMGWDAAAGAGGPGPDEGASGVPRCVAAGRKRVGAVESSARWATGVATAAGTSDFDPRCPRASAGRCTPARTEPQPKHRRRYCGHLDRGGRGQRIGRPGFQDGDHLGGSLETIGGPLGDHPFHDLRQFRRHVRCRLQIGSASRDWCDSSFWMTEPSGIVSLRSNKK